MGCGNQWKVQTQQTGHNNQGERRKEIFCGCYSTQDHRAVMKKNKKYLELIKKARTEHHVKLLLQRWSRYQSNSKTILVLLEHQVSHEEHRLS